MARRKPFLTAMALLLLFSPRVFCSAAFGQPWDGNGVEGDPYQIWTAADMQEVGADENYWDAYFLLMVDINLADYTGTQFNIIGTDHSSSFTGVFDGNNHTISNFTYSSIDTDYIGVFGYINGDNAEIKNLGLIDPNVNADTCEHVGSLVGRLYRGSISNCYSEGGTVSGDYLVGGIAGEVRIGGSLTNCYVASSISGDFSVGGLVGMSFGTVANCYASGSISGVEVDAGGVVGQNYGPISNCYASGSVEGEYYIGGLIGYNSDAMITHCYSSAIVTGSGEDIGGLIGVDDGSSYNKCFWDSSVNATLTGIGNGSDSNVIGKPTTEMQAEITFTNAGWDFTTPIWRICEGVDYPKLSWEEQKYGGGCGIEGNPFLIYTAAQLNTIGADSGDWDKQFQQMADVDLSDFNGLNGNPSFNSIGNSTTKFTGVFDGNRHTISNFIHNRALFRFVYGASAEVKDLHLAEPNIDGSGMVGALVDKVENGSISCCSVEMGIISGGDLVGGLVGYSHYGKLSNCSSTGQVSGGQQVGGLLGRNAVGTVLNCYSSGSVSGSGNFSVGGLLGENLSGTVKNCYSASQASGTYFVGGLIGNNFNYTASVSNCYATGSVVGTSGLGGLVGNNDEGTISTSYATGGVTGDDYIGGLVGFDDGGVYNKSFWDITVNPDVNGIGNINDPNVIGQTTANIQTQSTFTDAEWDFVDETANGILDYWRMCVDGVEYPLLSWQFTADFICPDGLDFLDLAFFVERWLAECDETNNFCNCTDINYDDSVNFLDFTILANYWLQP